MILVDTNVLFAAASTSDSHHEQAAGLLTMSTEPLLVPATVVAETCYLLDRWGAPAVESRFLRSLAPVTCSLSTYV